MNGWMICGLVVLLTISPFTGAQIEDAEETQGLKKVILDTDIGDDIDDVSAWIMVLNSPELELVGVTIENRMEGS